jgi:hypothetical protein
MQTRAAEPPPEQVFAQSPGVIPENRVLAGMMHYAFGSPVTDLLADFSFGHRLRWA